MSVNIYILLSKKIDINLFMLALRSGVIMKNIRNIHERLNLAL